MGLAPDFKSFQPVRFGSLIGKRDPDAPAGLPSDKRTEDAREGIRAYMAKAAVRRFACLKRAREALDHLPEQGEELHFLLSGFFDLAHFLVVALEIMACPCEVLRIATLSLSARNVQELVALLDLGVVKQLDLLAANFFAAYEKEITASAVEEFRQRNQRLAIARSHAKVLTVKLRDGRIYTLTGSANMRTCRNIEQACLSADPALFSFYDQWLSTMMDKYVIT
jgi:hypothetical protein